MSKNTPEHSWNRQIHHKNGNPSVSDNRQRGYVCKSDPSADSIFLNSNFFFSVGLYTEVWLRPGIYYPTEAKPQL